MKRSFDYRKEDYKSLKIAIPNERASPESKMYDLKFKISKDSSRHYDSGKDSAREGVFSQRLPYRATL